MKKCLILFLALILALSCVTPAFAAAAEENIQPRLTYIHSVNANLTISSSGSASCSATCSVSSGYTAYASCKLQQYKNGNWVTVKTWTVSGGSSAQAGGSYTVEKGYTYRVYGTFRAYNASGTLMESTYDTETYTY